jgi:glycosyltransferase involved in cell wall biosynthesis
MRRLLLVTYYYPPLAGSGVFRPLRLSKYLPRRGWNVTVLTVTDRVRTLKDPALVAEIPPAVHVRRSGSLEPRTLFLALNRIGLRALTRRLEPWLMVPDDQRGWVLPARRQGLALIREERPDVILSTAGPYSAHLVGLALKRASGLPWVADFRDEWTTNPYLRERYPTRWHVAWNQRVERRVLASADRVTCVSEPWLSNLHALLPEAPAERFAVLPNGYDGEHFATPAGPLPDRFRVVYTGTFYGHRSPSAFLRAVEHCVSSGSIPRAELEVVLVGHGRPPAGANGLVRTLGHRPYFEALALLREAAVLLLVVPRAGGAGNHTGKLFQYLASGRPILALAPEGNVAGALVRESRSGEVTAPDDVPAIAAALERLYHAWRERRPMEQDRAIVERYEATRQAEQWSELLERLVSA